MNKTIIAPSKPRNPLVPATKTRSGAGKHKNKKREDRNQHKD